TDHNEIKFNDLVVLDDRERADLESAHECFLLGLIFGEIRPERDATGRIRYVWSEQIGLVGKEKTIALGIELRALAELISKKATRDKLLSRIRDHIDRVRSDRDRLARFNSLLGWYFEAVYPETTMQGTDGNDYKEQSNMCRALDKQINEVVKFVNSRYGNTPELEREFIGLTQKYSAEIDCFAPILVDGKRALQVDDPAVDVQAAVGT
ncbi:MAG TPA: hypothetical protein VNG71_01495, partial [Pyrinomonadaceae bacterium]|nr:hypothetical protein [Pyrinomonadaceae bacterium]